MKKIAISLILSCLGFYVSAQFHVEVGLNYNFLFSSNQRNIYDYGLGTYIEPKYTLDNTIDLGILVGINGFGTSGDLMGPDPSVALGVAPRIIPVLATFTYRFPEGKLAPYAGLAFGYYKGKINSGPERFEMQGVDIEKFGLAPRAGVYLNRLNFGLVYNIIGEANFMQFNLGVRILSRNQDQT